MNNYVLENVGVFDAAQHAGKTVLIVHKLHRTPYHLGLLHNKIYFSLTVNGSEIKPETEAMQVLCDTTYNNLMLMVHLPTGIQTLANPAPFFNESILDATNFKSCLFPIRDWLTLILANNKIKETNNLFELLDVLKEHNFIGEISATRMTPVMEGKIVLERYTSDTIRKHIKRLQELAARENTNNNTAQ